MAEMASRGNDKPRKVSDTERAIAKVKLARQSWAVISKLDVIATA